MLLTDEQCKKVWDKVYDFLHFCPSVDTAVIPFKITAPHTVFDISGWDAFAFQSADRMITEALIRCTLPGEQLYALDWQHCAFLFDPELRGRRNPSILRLKATLAVDITHIFRRMIRTVTTTFLLTRSFASATFPILGGRKYGYLARA